MYRLFIVFFLAVIIPFSLFCQGGERELLISFPIILVYENDKDITEDFSDPEGRISIYYDHSLNTFILENKRINVNTSSSGPFKSFIYDLYFHSTHNVLADIFGFSWFYVNSYDDKYGEVYCFLNLFIFEDFIMPLLLLEQDDGFLFFVGGELPTDSYSALLSYYPMGLDYSSLDFDDSGIKFYIDSLSATNYFSKFPGIAPLIIDRLSMLSGFFPDEVQFFSKLMAKIRSSTSDNVMPAKSEIHWQENAWSVLSNPFDESHIENIFDGFSTDFTLSEENVKLIYLLKTFCEGVQYTYDRIYEINQIPPRIIREKELDKLYSEVKVFPYLKDIINQKRDRLMDDWHPIRKRPDCD